MMKSQPLILVVDDEPAVRNLVRTILTTAGYLVATAGNGNEALRLLQGRLFDLVLTDMLMPEMSGMELIQYVHLHYPDTLVIVFTGFASFQDAVDAVKLGAFDYLPKPLQPEILAHAIERALEYQRLLRSQRDLETVFQGAEALGWQALELVSATPEAEILRGLREGLWLQPDLQEVGHSLLLAAQDLMQVTNSSIFLYDAPQGKFLGLAALGPKSEAKAGAMITAAGIMGYVATHRRPLLVPDFRRSRHFSKTARHDAYRTDSFMVIPITGYKFWGVINLADRKDGEPFGPRDLFLGWLLGRLLVDILESRDAGEDLQLPTSLTPWSSEEIHLGVAFLDQNLLVVQANPTLERLAGLAGEDLWGREILSCLGLGPRDRESLQAAFQEMLQSREPQNFLSLKSSTREKEVRHLGIKMLPLPEDRGIARGLLLVEDVSELEQFKQHRLLYDHLATMGKLTLCVAHELNNPLDGIRRYLSLALLKKEQPQEVERYLSEAQKGLQKMALSIRSLMFSANPFKSPPRHSDSLHNLLEEAVKMMIFQARDQRVGVDFQAPPEFGKMMVEPDLYYVFINLIKNALQAMPAGGRLEVGGSIAGHRLEISFVDTGVGLSSQEVAKVFQPFYSTKEGLQGLGLGLPICRKILQRHDGSLVVAGHPGRGTKVQVILPYCAQEG
jgi:two-component system sporulation sensor kinase A